MGEYTADIFKVVSIALLSSWLMAMTFIPILTTIMMKIKPKKGEKDGKTAPYKGMMYRIYRWVLFPSLRFKVVPIIIVLILLVISVWALRFVPAVFIPGREDPVISAKFNMPRGTDIAVTEAVLLIVVPAVAASTVAVMSRVATAALARAWPV